MYNSIANHIIYPLGDLAFGTSVAKYYRMLKETQWWSPDQLQELQNDKLRRLIKHAYDSVPYYKQLFDNLGLKPSDIHSSEDLTKLPVLTKDIIRNHFDDLISVDINKRKAVLLSTSGSTGSPLKFYTDMNALSMGWAATFRAWDWAGYKIGDKRITFGGGALVPDNNASIIQTVRDKLERNKKLSSFGINDEILRRYTSQIEKYNPRFLRGYASSIYELAQFMQKNSIRSIKPRAVFTTAEMLLPHYRETIENQFQCQVFDNWGCNDGGGNACECEKHSGFHIASERSIVEFDRQGNNETSSKILLTDLHNYSMPFIRYVNGDIGTPSEQPCECGRNLPLIKNINGRISDFVTTPEGLKIHGEFFSHIFWELDSFLEFQIIQPSSDRWIIKVVPAENAASYSQTTEIEKMKNIIYSRSSNIKLDIEITDKIPLTESGKHKFIINEIA